MREMQRRLEHDAKLQKFFDIKGQKRLNPELEQRENNKKLAQKEAFEKQLKEYKEIIERMKVFESIKYIVKKKLLFISYYFRNFTRKVKHKS